jgi:predicted amidophosphoribosyltransferase
MYRSTLWKRQYRKALRKAGLCIQCKRKRERLKSLCDRCAKMRTANKQKYRERTQNASFKQT